jgi:hypothetical protein
LGDDGSGERAGQHECQRQSFDRTWDVHEDAPIGK